jgi:RNase H-like domain found in reverse transcriptase/Reverse transcriptase (RNA-dependent DNA polymerase)
MSNAYEQIRVEPQDVWKTAFATIYGTFVSHTMQQGDCNAPATFQRPMTVIFREFIGRFVHVYLDDIFVYSNSIEEHKKHLGLIFDKLRQVQLYLEESKLDLYSKRMDCLGHLIDDRGIHADSNKMARVHEWRTPRNKHNVQRFLGLVQYLAHFMPDVSAYTGPLAAIQKNGHPFLWRPIHQKCMDNIKILACKTPILQPIDPSSDEPIWVICDASASGIGAVYRQGPTWQTCRPARFMSKKFTSAQHNYRVFEMETIAILEALLKWEDKLLGNRVNIVTDHRALEFFNTQ